MSQKTHMSIKDESRELMAVWPDVVRDLTDAGRHLDIPDVTKWLAKVLFFFFLFIFFFFCLQILQYRTMKIFLCLQAASSSSMYMNFSIDSVCDFRYKNVTHEHNHELSKLNETLLMKITNFCRF